MEHLANGDADGLRGQGGVSSVTSDDQASVPAERTSPAQTRHYATYREYYLSNAGSRPPNTSRGPNPRAVRRARFPRRFDVNESCTAVSPSMRNAARLAIFEDAYTTSSWAHSFWERAAWLRLNPR